jgi:hypothetical protein
MFKTPDSKIGWQDLKGIFVHPTIMENLRNTSQRERDY